MSAPRWAVWLLARLAPASHVDDVIGDLEEAHGLRVQRRGRRMAALLTGFEAIDMAIALIRVRITAGRPAAEAPGPEDFERLVRDERRSGMRSIAEAWVRDLGQAVRSLVRAPGFALITIATLALAIGTNTAIFSVVDAVLLDPLAFPEPDRLVSIRGTAPGSDLPEEFGVGTEFYVQYRENAAALEDLGLYQTGQTTVSADEHVERLFVSSASPSLFTTLGVTPEVGRLPTEQDEEGNVMVLSHRLWTDWFARDPSVVGRTVEVSGRLVTVLGVMRDDFRFPDDRTSLWVHDLPTEPIQPGGFGLNLVGRLAPGADHATLAAQLDVLAKRLPERFGGPPAYARIIEQHRPVVRSLEQEMVGDFASALWVLAGTVGIVLLIACANVANLLIVRAETRRRDLAVRRALGAGRGGLIRAQMTEALLLAAAGGAGGAALAWVGVPMLVRAAPESIPRLDSVSLDGTALLFTAGLSILAALAAGLLPAVRFSNPGYSGLRLGTRIASGANHVTRNALVVVQTAAALVLLVASGLLVQSFRELGRVDAGFETEDIFTFQMAPDPETHGLSDGPSLARFHYVFMDRLAALPGVEQVGLVNTLPLDEGAGNTRIATEQTVAEAGTEPIVNFTFIGGDYFQTMGIDLVTGQHFERRTEPIGDPPAIVSRAAAELLWPGEDPIGKRLRPAGAEDLWVTVVGVVEDIFLSDFRQEAPDPMIYMPMVGATPDAWGVGTPAYVMKTERAGAIADEVRALVREIAPEAPMYRVFTMEALAARSKAQLTFTMLTMALAAVLGLVLGAVGLYGVLSYVVAQRTREIGIRMALGAQTRALRRMVVAQGGRVALIGVVIGVLGALWLTRILDTLLFGIGSSDAPTIIAMSVLMLGVAVLASYVPARRASAVDPVRSLRAE